MKTEVCYFSSTAPTLPTFTKPSHLFIIAPSVLVSPPHQTMRFQPYTAVNDSLLCIPSTKIMIMNDVAERVRSSIENLNTDPWFPELVAGLIARAWDKLNGDYGLTPINYGTVRVISRNITAPRDIIASLEA